MAKQTIPADWQKVGLPEASDRYIGWVAEIVAPWYEKNTPTRYVLVKRVRSITASGGSVRGTLHVGYGPEISADEAERAMQAWRAKHPAPSAPTPDWQ